MKMGIIYYKTSCPVQGAATFIITSFVKPKNHVAGEADEDPGEAGHDARLEPGEQTPGQSGQESGDKTTVPAVRRQVRVRDNIETFVSTEVKD